MLLKPPLSELSSIFYFFSNSRINIRGLADGFFFSRFHLKAHFIVCEDPLAAAASARAALVNSFCIYLWGSVHQEESVTSVGLLV